MIGIDSFCVPIKDMAKRATLESMGFIYAHAAQVVIVLSNEAFVALEMMSQFNTAPTKSTITECLDVLKNNEWIRSTWTYQKVVNCQDLLFMGEGMAGQDFFSRFGH